MPKRRDLVAMNDQELWEFIATQKNIQVCTLNQDGTPHLTVMWFAIKDKTIILETFTKSQKIANLKRNPNMAVLLEDGDRYNRLRGVSINCQAELIDDYPTVHALHIDVAMRNEPGITFEQADEGTREISKKKTVIVVKPEKVMSWDHRKLGGKH